MKKILTITMLAAFFACFQSSGQIFKDAKKIFKGQTALTEEDAAAGIKEALIKGTDNGVEIISKIDGYFKNPEIKIPFPPEAVNIEERLRALGFGNKVDEVILTINRAAEDAATAAKPIFVTAVRQMTVRDALDIVRGEKNAATMYLKNTTSPELVTQFKPKIEISLDKVNATKYWEDLITIYNQIPFIQKVNPDLAQYVTEKAIDGLFIMIAKEEERIRRDPLARTTEILRKVFGQ
jgi:hypothetical protein